MCEIDDGVDAHRDVRVVRVGALTAGPHHAGVHHPGHAHLVHVRVLARDLVGDVDAGDRVRVLEDRLVRRDRLRRRDARLQRHVGAAELEVACRRQLAVGDGLAAARDDALVDRQLRGGHAELRRGHAEQRLARERRDVAELRAGARHRVRAALAAGADGVVGVDDGVAVRVEQAVPHLRHVHVELFGDHLQEAGRDAVAGLDLARLERPQVVGGDREPRVDLVDVGVVAGRVATGARRRLAGKGRAREAEPDDQRAAALDERLARELLLVQKTGHLYAPPFAITAAAFWIAVRIRG